MIKDIVVDDDDMLTLRRLFHYLKFRLTNLAWKHSVRLVIGDLEVSAMNPVDTILMKAFLQRGVELGKHDIQHIEKLLSAVDIDRKYLKASLLEINLSDKVLRLLHNYDLMLKQY